MKFIAEGNLEYKETDSISYVQSSLKYHPLYAPL